MPEDAYYRALARHLACEYYDGETPFAPEFDPVRGLRSGVAPLVWNGHGARAVIAPRAQSVPHLIEMALSGQVGPGSFAVSSPHRFAALVRERRGGAILDHALGRLSASLSARGGLSGAQIAALVAIVLCAVWLLALSFDALQAVASAGLWLAFSASIASRSMAAVATDPKVRPSLLSDDELPFYTVVAAVYKEANVIEDLIRAFDAIDYPKAKLDIKLVVERRDLETLSRIAELSLPARYEVIVAPPGEPSTKPRALNIALACARGELIAVFDAEDAPAPDQLRLAASRFASEKTLDCLQARLSVRNREDSWLSKLFSIEYAALFDLINPGLCALELPIALGGTSNHFRVRSLTAVGGWDEWNVAEDADLGIRLARFGYRVASLDSETSEEAPHELANWFRQRVRWEKGWIRLSRLAVSLSLFNGLRHKLSIFSVCVATLSQQMHSFQVVDTATAVARRGRADPNREHWHQHSPRLFARASSMKIIPAASSAARLAARFSPMGSSYRSRGQRRRGARRRPGARAPLDLFR